MFMWHFLTISNKIAPKIVRKEKNGEKVKAQQIKLLVSLEWFKHLVFFLN